MEEIEVTKEVSRFDKFFRGIIKKEDLLRYRKALFFLVFVVFLAYIFAGMVASLTLHALVQMGVAGKDLLLKEEQQGGAAFASSDGLNYRDLKRSIMERNVFNKDGTFPDEKVEEKVAETKKEDFDMNASCSAPTLKLTLLGTIYLGEGKSFATIKEDVYPEADIYTVGDLLIGHEEAQIAGIHRNRVIINNKGKKECLIIDLGEKLLGIPVEDEIVVKKTTATTASSANEPVVLQSSWVESELGPGFGKIIQSARLVPYVIADGSVGGFKIYAIDPGTIFEKIGLTDGDVITQVNDTVLQADSGFSLYQAFLDQREIRLHILRKAKTPQTILVQIK
ncbi:MAG: hypothetical protein KA436_05915 [Oligoflexales bacterium]|nr:hypothetical protein [Oligoflexales bacterium]